MTRIEAFKKKNRGRWAVEQAGILVMRAFNTSQSARKWALWNYRNKSGWKIIQL